MSTRPTTNALPFSPLTDVALVSAAMSHASSAGARSWRGEADAYLGFGEIERALEQRITNERFPVGAVAVHCIQLRGRA